MKKLLKYTLITAFFIFHTVAFADAPVWKLSKGDDALFIGGTIHVLNSPDHPMPKAFMEAYRQSDRIMFEADIGVIHTPAFQQQVLQVGSYPPGKTIQDFLEPETLKKLEKHCAIRGIPLQNLSNFRAGLLTLTLQSVELQRLQLIIPGAGVEEFFNLLALNDRKPIEFLETIDEHLEFIAQMGAGHENDIVEKTLQEMETIADDMADLKAVWRNANLQRLIENFLIPMQEEYSEAYTDIIYDRNIRWLPKIEALFDNDTTELVLVGMLHVVGEDGIIQLLEKKGYKAEQLD